MSEVKVLFIGDIVGKLGRQALKQYLPKLQKKYVPDLVLANGENLAHGKGLTSRTANEVLSYGVDLLTSGNHVFAQKEVIPYLKQLPILRPANYPAGTPGLGSQILKVARTKIGIINLEGRVFMNALLDCPFRTADKILQELTKQKVKLIIIDLHAEASSEKVALFRYLDGRVSAVLGTHTHIQTADEEVSVKGTAYLTDVGAVYAKESIIGVTQEIIIDKFLSALSRAHEIPETGSVVFNAVLMKFDSRTGKALAIQRIYEIV